MKKNFLCFAVSILFFVPFLVIVIRMGTALYVDYTDNSNRLTDFILQGRSIETVSSGDEWIKKYPFHQGFSKSALVQIEETQKVITGFCTSSFPFSEQIHELIQLYRENILQNTLNQDGGEYGAVASNIAQAPDYVAPLVENVLDFEDFCNKQGVPFLYIQTPRKDLALYYEGKSEGIKNPEIVYRSLAFQEQLAQKSSSVLFLGSSTIPQHIYEYDSTSHWSFEDSLFASQCIAQELNERFGFAFTTALSDPNNYQDFFAPYRSTMDLPQQKLPTPVQQGSYTRIYAEGAEIVSGGFSTVCIQPIEKYSSDGVYYSMAIIGNSLMSTIQNHTTTQNCGKKILVIGDSFDWFVVPYLAQQVSEITFLHNASFTGSLHTYIQTYQPDLVLVMYNDTEFFQEYSEDAFDFN